MRPIAAVAEAKVDSTRIFLSFDVDRDNDCRWLFCRHADCEGLRFEIADWSIREVAADWQEKARIRIARVDLLVVLCGEHSDTAPGVNAELSFAREAQTPYLLLDGRPGGRCMRPKAARTSDEIHNWTWRTLGPLIERARATTTAHRRG